MLGGLKAALGGSRRGPVLPLSGVQVVHQRSKASTSASSTGRSCQSCDEETPPDPTRASTFGCESPKKFCELSGSYVDVEAGPRISTASTGVPPTSAGTAATVNSERSPTRGSSAGGEQRIGLTQLVISLDLDILGPAGLLAQLGFPAQHELETCGLRIQCSGMEVRHRTSPDCSRTTLGSHRDNARRVVADAIGCDCEKDRLDLRPAVDCAKALPFTGAAFAEPQQFYIGESDLDPCSDRHEKAASREGGDGQLPDDFARLFAPETSRSQGIPSRSKRRPGPEASPDASRGSRNSNSDEHRSIISNAAGLGRFTGAPPATSNSRAEPQVHRAGCTDGLREAAGPPSSTGNSPGNVGLPVLEISGFPGLGSKSRPLTRKPNGGKAEELQELQELRRRNLRLERDLYETLQALDEESLASSPSSPSASSVVDSPLPSPKPGPLAAKMLQELQVCTSLSRPSSAPKAVDTPPVALRGSLPSMIYGRCNGDGECSSSEFCAEAKLGALRPPLSTSKSQAAGSPAQNPRTLCKQPLHSFSSPSSSSGVVIKRIPEKALFADGAQAEFELGTPGSHSEDEDSGSAALVVDPNSIFRGTTCSVSSTTQRAKGAQT